jgi:hypothetical protein
MPYAEQRRLVPIMEAVQKIAEEYFNDRWIEALNDLVSALNEGAIRAFTKEPIGLPSIEFSPLMNVPKTQWSSSANIVGTWRGSCLLPRSDLGQVYPELENSTDKDMNPLPSSVSEGTPVDDRRTGLSGQRGTIPGSGARDDAEALERIEALLHPHEGTPLLSLHKASMDVALTLKEEAQIESTAKRLRRKYTQKMKLKASEIKGNS